MKTTTTQLAAAAALVLACGESDSTDSMPNSGGGKADIPYADSGESGEGEGEGGDTAGPGSDVPDDGTVEACRLDSYETLTVVTGGEWGGWSRLQEDGETLVGWDIDYVDRVMAIIGAEYEFNIIGWGGGCCEVGEDVTQGIAPSENADGLLPELFHGAGHLSINISSDSERRVSVFGRDAVSTRYGFGPNHTAFNFSADNEAAFDFDASSLAEILVGKRFALAGSGSNQDFYLRLLADESGLTVGALDEGADVEIIVTDALVPDGGDPVAFADQMVVDGDADATFGSPAPGSTLATAGFVRDLDTERFNRVWGTGAAIFFRPDIESVTPGLVDAVNCAIEHIARQESELYVDLRREHDVQFCNPMSTDEQCDAELAAEADGE